MKVKEILLHLGKVFLYVAGSVLVGVLLSPELREWVKEYPQLAAIAPILNLVFVLIAEALKKYLPSKE